jgi:hypothetical protein
MLTARSNNTKEKIAEANSFAAAQQTPQYRSHQRHRIDGQGENQWLVVLVRLDTKK